MTMLQSVSIIDEQLAIIEKAKAVLKEEAQKLLEFAPFKVGDELECNGFSHMGKKFLVDRVYVSGKMGHDAKYSGEEPMYFKAEGLVYRADKTLGVFRGEHLVKIKDLISGSDV